MTNHPIPDAALAVHTAVLGKTGSGKTSTAKLAIEQVVAQGARVCVLDPIKSDWWGVTSSADGRRPGLPFQILGGPYGHVPLTSSAGAAVGELVANGDLPLSIIDMKKFGPGGLQHFFIAFAERLLDRMRGAVYLVLEEAHEFAPKERDGFGDINMAVFWAKKLATSGRSQGIRLILSTQRTQNLHNALLGSCETLIAHRLVLEADQKPVLGWLKNLNKTLVADVAPSLASLPTGTGWLCSGEAGLFKKVAFPRISTFDNTATPTGELTDRKVKQAPIDVGRLRSLIGAKVAEAEANDPIRLKARIAELEKAASAKTGTVVEKPDPVAAAAAEERGYDRGFLAGHQEGVVAGWAKASEAVTAAMLHDPPKIAKAPAPSSAPIVATPRTTAASPPIVTAADRTSVAGLSPALQRVLDALAWWRAAGHAAVPRARACVVAGYSPKASTFGVYVSDLVKRGLVTTGGGMVGLSDAGVAVADVPNLASRAQAREAGRALLKPQEIRVFDAVYDAHPKPIRRNDVAAAVGLSPAASTVGVYLSAVAAFGLIETAGRGEVRAAPWLFDIGR